MFIYWWDISSFIKQIIPLIFLLSVVVVCLFNRQIINKLKPKKIIKKEINSNDVRMLNKNYHKNVLTNFTFSNSDVAIVNIVDIDIGIFLLFLIDKIINMEIK